MIYYLFFHTLQLFRLKNIKDNAFVKYVFSCNSMLKEITSSHISCAQQQQFENEIKRDFSNSFF